MTTFADECPVRVTPLAVAHIRQVMDAKNLDRNRYGLRVGVKGGGCGGAAPLLGFDTATESDHRYALQHFSVLVEKKHLMYVIGLEIDYQDTGEVAGFVFNKGA